MFDHRVLQDFSERYCLPIGNLPSKLENLRSHNRFKVDHLNQFRCGE
jgi:hypothetical protein